MTAANPNPMHLAKSVEHYSPPEMVEPARVTLGEIDVDPASCVLANRIVRARHILTREDDGLGRSWGVPWDPSRVLCNPPGGKGEDGSIQKQWWIHGAGQWAAGVVDALIWIAFKLDFLQLTQSGLPPGVPVPLDGAICYPRTRTGYYAPAHTAALPGFEIEALRRGESPPHASAVIYLPSRRDPEGLARFDGAFSSLGQVRWDARALARIGIDWG